MNTLREFNTPIAKVTAFDNEIYREVWQLESIQDLDLAKQHVDLLFTDLAQNELKNLYIISDVRKVKKVSKAVRDYLGNDDDTSALKGVEPAATALLLKSGISKILGTLFLKFNKPKVPIRLFLKEEKAMEWLLEQKHKNN